MRYRAAILSLLLIPTTTGAAALSGHLQGDVVDASQRAMAGVNCQIKRTTQTTDKAGRFVFGNLAPGVHKLTCRRGGFRTTITNVSVRAGGTTRVHVVLRAMRAKPAQEPARDEVDSLVRKPRRKHKVQLKTAALGSSRSYGAAVGAGVGSGGGGRGVGRVSYGVGGWGGSYGHRTMVARPSAPPPRRPDWNREAYDRIEDKDFASPRQKPLSTVSIDVDSAAYSNVRRFVTQGKRPPKDAVRIEELINYFDYAYPNPTGDVPFAVHAEVSSAPWNPKHRLVHIGLQGSRVPTADLPPNNLVFLIDVSGSMHSADKLPLLQSAFSLLVDQLREEDRVSIVVYAGAAGLVLKPTSGADKTAILDAIGRLRAGGSTAGGAGIQLAYEVARKTLMPKGNNRVILATDGDFNIGTSSDGELERLIEKERKSGVFLTVLGFGTGNYQDSKMQKLADKGNGNHAYIDSLFEAQKVMVREMGATLLTIAKDVKVQVEFNPKKVKGWRLIGYENRVLAARDFDDDKKDAGELGAGHSVTFLYELIPAGSDETVEGHKPLRYQQATVAKAADTDELLHVKLRYKAPKSSKSKLLMRPLHDRHTDLAKTTNAFRFSAAVAELGLCLRASKHRGNATIAAAISRAKGAKGDDPHGDRAEFVKMARRLQAMTP